MQRTKGRVVPAVRTSFMLPTAPQAFTIAEVLPVPGEPIRSRHPKKHSGYFSILNILFVLGGH